MSGLSEFLITSERSDNIYSKTRTNPAPSGNTSKSCTTYTQNLLVSCFNENIISASFTIVQGNIKCICKNLQIGFQFLEEL